MSDRTEEPAAEVARRRSRTAPGDAGRRPARRPPKPCCSRRRGRSPRRTSPRSLEADREALTAALTGLQRQADAAARGVRLEQVAGGWRYVTRPEFDSLLRKFHEVTERSRLSLAALETLAIIAYRQPITLPEIQEIRGVNSASVLKTLFEKRLVTTAGQKPVVGTPFFYKTTSDFLVRFGLKELGSSPSPRSSPRIWRRRSRRGSPGGAAESPRRSSWKPSRADPEKTETSTMTRRTSPGKTY